MFAAAGGQQWKETHYKVTGWTQNIKSLLPFQGKHTIRYGGANMELSAATSVAETSLGLKGASFLFTVCLDHCMRVWNLKTGQVLHSGDILGVGRDPHEVGRWTIDPSQQNLIRLVDVGADGHAICATYSPVGSGAFKFWRVEAAGDGVGDAISVTDMFPNDDLTPPMPASPDVWTLTDFSVETRGIGHGGEWEIQLWTLWKNNMTYRVQRLSFPPENVASAWRSSWIAVHSEGIMPPQPAAPSGPWDAADVAEKWLQLIFGPGRFTRSTLETALAIYERSVGARTSDRESASSSRTQYPKDHRGLAEAVSAVLASAATLNRDSAGGLDYEQYRTATNTQWQRFYRLLLELDRQRGEALSLATDPVLGITWVVCADCISAIRRCSPLERLQLNPYSSRLRGKPGSLVEAGAQFVDAIPDSHLQICNAVLRPEIYEDSSQTDYERIQYFSDKTGLWRVLTDEDCQQVTKLLGNNFKDVSTGLYQETLGLIFATDGSTSRDIRYPLTEFGRRLFVKTVQDTADMHWNFCFAQLILLVHMTFEFEQEEDALHNRLDIGAVYRQLVASLRRLELVRWLLHKEISVVIPREHSGGTASPTTPKHAKADVQVISVFEASVGHLLGLTRLHGKGLLECYLTDVAIDICAPDSDTELSTALVQCSLLTRDRGDLALELSPFCEHDPFSTYVQGRVFLAVRDFESAAIHFERAAYGMSECDRLKQDKIK